MTGPSAPADPEHGGDTVRVRCYAGYRGEETPRTVVEAGRELEVLEILERWLEPGRRCFRVRTEDGVGVLVHEEPRDRWRSRRAAESHAG